VPVTNTIESPAPAPAAPPVVKLAVPPAPALAAAVPPAPRPVVEASVPPVPAAAPVEAAVAKESVPPRAVRAAMPSAEVSLAPPTPATPPMATMPALPLAPVAQTALAPALNAIKPTAAPRPPAPAPQAAPTPSRPVLYRTTPGSHFLPFYYCVRSAGPIDHDTAEQNSRLAHGAFAIDPQIIRIRADGTPEDPATALPATAAHYTVQFAAFANEPNASRFAEQLQRSGVAAKVLLLPRTTDQAPAPKRTDPENLVL
jgi:hypothetical protein